eukprot:scaffold19440_cov99-Isochrysis_galbana.AAC.1
MVVPAPLPHPQYKVWKKNTPFLCEPAPPAGPRRAPDSRGVGARTTIERRVMVYDGRGVPPGQFRQPASSRTARAGSPIGRRRPIRSCGAPSLVPFPFPAPPPPVA